MPMNRPSISMPWWRIVRFVCVCVCVLQVLSVHCLCEEPLLCMRDVAVLAWVSWLCACACWSCSVECRLFFVQWHPPSPFCLGSKPQGIVYPKRFLLGNFKSPSHQSKPPMGGKLSTYREPEHVEESRTLRGKLNT